MRAARSRTSRVPRWAALSTGVVLLAGCCSQNFNAHLGIRPDMPGFKTTDSACAQFEARINYSQDLLEAYHTRATQNRAWLYVAGTLLLGTAAATGGLGAAGAAGLSIALLSISGATTSGIFAMIDNSTLADVYTICANELADGITDARAKLKYDGLTLNQESCLDALTTLDAAVTAAATKLERARTDSSVAALVRAQGQLERLQTMLSTASPTPTATPSTPAPASPSS